MAARTVATLPRPAQRRASPSPSSHKAVFSPAVRRAPSLLIAASLSLAPSLGAAQSDAGVVTVQASGTARLTTPDASLPATNGTPDSRERDDSAAPTPAPESPAQIQARIHYDQSRTHYAAGHYRAAVRELEAAVRIDPQGANLWYNLGAVSERLGDIDRARVAYGRYLDRTSDPVERERTRRILTRLDGARIELAAMSRQHGLADGYFWAATGLALGATGFGVAWLASTPSNESTVAPWAVTAGGLSLGLLATVLYFAREAPRGRSLLVSASPTGQVALLGSF